MAVNVFEELGFEPEEAEVLVAKSTLMDQIKDHVEDEYENKDLVKLGMQENEYMRSIMTGKIDEVSIENLVRIAKRLGMHVNFNVHRIQE